MHHEARSCPLFNGDSWYNAILQSASAICMCSLHARFQTPLTGCPHVHDFLEILSPDFTADSDAYVDNLIHVWACGLGLASRSWE